MTYPVDVGNFDHEVVWTAELYLPTIELDQARAGGWAVEGWEVGAVDRLPAHRGELTRIRLLPLHNLVVNNGITRLQNLGWGIGGVTQVMNCIGVDNGTGIPSAADLKVGAVPVGDATTTAARIQAFDAAATQSAQVVSQTATFTQAGVGFVMKHLSISFIAPGSLPISYNGTPAVAGTNAGVLAAVPAASLHSCTAPFTIDLTSFATWSAAFTATVTGTGS